MAYVVSPAQFPAASATSATLAARLRRCVGFRNVLVHEYVEIDWSIVLRVLGDGAEDLAAFGKHMLRALEAAED